MFIKYFNYVKGLFESFSWNGIMINVNNHFKKKKNRRNKLLSFFKIAEKELII